MLRQQKTFPDHEYITVTDGEASLDVAEDPDVYEKHGIVRGEWLSASMQYLWGLHILQLRLPLRKIDGISLIPNHQAEAVAYLRGITDSIHTIVSTWTEAPAAYATFAKVLQKRLR